MHSYRICFAGTPAFAAGHLDALLNSPHQLCAVLTQPDRPAGRGKRLLPSPVKQLALDNNLPVHQPASLKSAEAEQLLVDLDVDLLIVVAYGLILPASILAIPKLGCINVHASLLPRWRGAAPIERAILAGDSETGITIMQMDAGLDTGPMLLLEATPITETDSRDALEERLMQLGRRLLTDTLADYESLRANATEQDDSLSTYAAKLDKTESEVDWHNSARQILRQIRATAGRNPAYSHFNSDRLRLLDAKVLSDFSGVSSSTEPGTIIDSDRHSFTVLCGEQALQITAAQLPGKKAMAVTDISNSRPDLFATGKQFSSPANAT